MKINRLIISALLLANAACGHRNARTVTVAESDSTHYAVRYASGFAVHCCDGYKLLEVHDPQDDRSHTARFALIPRGTKPTVPDDYTPIEVPVRNVICMTTLQLSNFITLDRLDAVKGVTSTRHLHNEAMRRRLGEGSTQRIGIEGNFDNEVILNIAPDLILISPFQRGGYDALRDVGTPLLPHFGYKEPTPLGQAEWIRCVGLLMGDEERADSLFNAIETRYNALCALTEQVERRPTVFSGELRGGNWYAVGGRSFLAQLFRDAGADYFLRDDPRSGGVTLDFEQVYTAAANADYWRILNSFESTFTYDALRDEDERYTDFRAWKSHGVIYCNLRETPFYEATPMQPDVVLADLIKVFHPELVADHRPVYYRLLP